MMIMLPNYFTMMMFDIMSVLRLTSHKKSNQLIKEADFQMH